jgi:Mrp family chromosome partitioning ATPase
MGKIRETFRVVVEERVAPPGSPVADGKAGPPADEEPVVEMPFIEIGPRRHIEASPGLLDLPRPAAPAPAPARPSGVCFRALPPAPHTAGTARRPRFAAELLAYHAPGQPASAQYAELLSAVLGAARGRAGPEGKVLLFTAVRTGVGATTALLNLAITAARQGRRVIVVDANLRRSAVADRLGLERYPGLTEVLAGDIALAGAIRATAQEGLLVLSAGAPAALWADPESLRGLLAALAGQSDLVLVDGPCWDSRSGAASLAAVCEAAFLVVPAAEADTPPASELVHSLPAQGVALAGCVLTAA